MATASLARVRFAGVILGLLGLALLAGGFAFVCLALHWPMPNWVPAEYRVVPQGTALALDALRDTPLGLGAGFLVVFGGLACLNGLYMMTQGRRSWLLVVPMVVMFAVAVVVAVLLPTPPG